ncbi:C6 transcription factor [Colletotrichum kahawae]|uniref:C6 transcription factor n=1 Tax=Colletotrichum kahawae TaxID=34407 RepID=A0AAD9XZL0_COLKA|nr:C6 transcription factor [Colletotrichum kahawae]
MRLPWAVVIVAGSFYNALAMSILGHENFLPQRTLSSEQHAVLSPPAAPAPTPAPRLRFRNAALAVRAAADTCGFVSDPFNCSSTCTAVGAYLGCGTSKLITECYDGTATFCSSGASIGESTRCCTDTTDGWRPWCVDYVKKTTSEKYLTRKGCYNGFWAINNTFASQVFLVNDPTDIVKPSTSGVSLATLTVVTTIEATVSDSLDESSTPTPATTSSASEPSQTNIGAIVGGVVGGVAVIALAVCMIVWLVLRRRKGAHKDDPSPTSDHPETSQPFIQPYETSSPGNQDKRLSQQQVQQRPHSVSPVPQYS